MTPAATQGKLNQLVRVIRRGIDGHGFYILMDDRLQLIAGDDCTFENTDEHRDAIRDFADAHHWFVEVSAKSITFRRKLR